MIIIRTQFQVSFSCVMLVFSDDGWNFTKKIRAELSCLSDPSPDESQQKHLSTVSVFGQKIATRNQIIHILIPSSQCKEKNFLLLDISALRGLKIHRRDIVREKILIMIFHIIEENIQYRILILKIDLITPTHDIVHVIVAHLIRSCWQPVTRRQSNFYHSDTFVLAEPDEYC